MKIKQIMASQWDKMFIVQLTDERFALISIENEGDALQISDQYGGFLRYGYFEPVDTVSEDIKAELAIILEIRKDEAEARYQHFKDRKAKRKPTID